MKNVLIVLVVLLCACSEKSEVEKRYIGKWSWDVSKNGYREAGYLDLRKDGKYTYSISSWNPSEKLSETFEDHVYEWYLKDGKVCLKRGQNESGFGDKCWWNAVVELSGNPSIEFDGVFLTGRIKATKNE